MAITLAKLVQPGLIGLAQRTAVRYSAHFTNIRLTENMVDKRESYTKKTLKHPAVASCLALVGHPYPQAIC